MSYGLTTYGGKSNRVVTPSAGLSAAGRALNDNFEFLVDNSLLAGASVSDGDGDGLTVCSGANAITAAGPTSLDGGAIITDGNEDLSINNSNEFVRIYIK
jgi:hypothetical protein